MAISPLQSYSLIPAHPETGIPKKNNDATASFDSLLSSLRSSAGSSTMAGQQAAADLFRIEMMQRSLALSGAGDSAPSSALAALGGLVAPTAGFSAAALSPEAYFRKPAAPPVPMPRAELVTPASADPTAALSIESTASQYLGTPYRFGGESASGIDCSSFVQQVFREHQIELPRTAREQIKMGTEVAPGQLQKGDLVFFHTYASYPSHVGIYLGDGKMIHASSGRGEVTVSSLDSDYYRSRFIGAKRVV